MTKRTHKVFLKKYEYYVIKKSLAEIETNTIVMYKGWSKSSKDPNTLWHIFEQMGDGSKENSKVCRLIRRQIDEHLSQIFNFNKVGGNGNVKSSVIYL